MPEATAILLAPNLLVDADEYGNVGQAGRARVVRRAGDAMDRVEALLLNDFLLTAQGRD